MVRYMLSVRLSGPKFGPAYTGLNLGLHTGYATSPGDQIIALNNGLYTGTL